MAEPAKTDFFGRLKSAIGRLVGSDDLESRLQDIHKRLEPLSDEDLESLRETMTDELKVAESRHPHEAAEQLISAARDRLYELGGQLSDLGRQVEALKEDWLERERFSERGWAEISREIDHCT